MAYSPDPRALALSLALAACTTFAAHAQDKPAATQADVRAALEAGGYTSINDVEFDDGIWKADARSADGNRVEVSVDPQTLAIRPDEQVSKLSDADVRAALSAQGYTHVHDVDYDDGIWKAEANDASGKAVELRIDPETGKVMGSEQD